MLQTPPLPDLAPPTPAAPVPDVPHVRPGSHWDAKQLRGRIQTLLAGIERADDQVRMLCALAREKKIFMLLEDPQGRYFPDWTAFCTAPVPWGLGLDQGLLAEVAKEQSDPKRLARLALEAPLRLRTTGGQRGPRTGGAARRATRGTDYRLQRLKRDRPDLLQQLATGELPSITEAWRLAGLHLPKASVLLDPMNVARLVVTRLSTAEQREVLDLLRHPEQITPPAGGRCPHWEEYRARTVAPEVLAQERAAHRDAQKQKWAAEARDRRAAAAAAQRAQAQALGLPSLATAEAAG